jgi:hypothetical protein
MIQTLQHGARKLAVIACAMFLVACAGTGEQAGYKQLTSADVAKVTQGMTKEQIEQAIGRPDAGMRRDRQGNEVLHYHYTGSGAANKTCLFVTIDPASGKVSHVQSRDW